MEWMDMISLTVVLLLALYGCAQAICQLVCTLLRPREPCVKLMLTLKGDRQDVEQHIRYAQALSEKLSLRLLVVDEGLSSQAKGIAQALLENGTGEFCGDSIGKITCADDTRRV